MSFLDLGIRWESLLTTVFRQGGQGQLLKKSTGSWKHKNLMFSHAIEEDWYQFIFILFSDIHIYSNMFFYKKGILPALMPVTCGSVSSPMGLGSDSLPVSVELFGEKTYLADSMQFHLEYLLRHTDKGVFYIMPTFRGEDPDKRHLNQFFHAEAEIVGDLNDVMILINEYITFLTKSIYLKHKLTLKKFGIDVGHLKSMLSLNKKIPKITFTDALEVLGEDERFYNVLPGNIRTISSLGEKKLIEHSGGIVWLTNPPATSVPFYQAKDGSGENALCADLLFGIGEVVGCGQRHFGYKETIDALEEHEVDESEYEWYLKMKKNYPMQTSGFGLGIERFLMWILRHEDIRDIPLFNRLKGFNDAP
jgi:asparaginyl-tRNA synthetase